MLLAIGMLLPTPRIASLLPELCSLGDTIRAGLFCTLLLELDCESRGSMGGEGGGRLGAIAEDDFLSEAFQNLRYTALTAVGKLRMKWWISLSPLFLCRHHGLPHPATPRAGRNHYNLDKSVSHSLIDLCQLACPYGLISMKENNNDGCVKDRIS